MPIFEHQIGLQTKGKEGNPVTLSPPQGLQFVGPVLNVIVSPTKQHLESLARKGETAPQPIFPAWPLSTLAPLRRQ
jgi:hypothetical protein